MLAYFLWQTEQVSDDEDEDEDNDEDWDMGDDDIEDWDEEDLVSCEGTGVRDGQSWFWVSSFVIEKGQ